MESRKVVLLNLFQQGRIRDTDVENGYVDTVREGKGGWIERAALAYTLPCVNRQLVGSYRVAWGAQRVLCDDLEELDGKGGRETQEGEDICSSIAEIYAVVYQKLTQHRKAIVLQFKKKCTYHVPVLSSIFFLIFVFVFVKQWFLFSFPWCLDINLREVRHAYQWLNHRVCLDKCYGRGCIYYDFTENKWIISSWGRKKKKSTDLMTFELSLERWREGILKAKAEVGMRSQAVESGEGKTAVGNMSQCRGRAG